MLKKEIKSHFGVVLIWLAAVTFLRWDWGKYLFFFWFGGLLGTFLFDTDHLIDILFVHPNWPTTQKVKDLLCRRRWQSMLELLAEIHDERFRLSFHNALFQIVFWVFCFWVLTSSGSWLGRGLVMSMALHLLKDEFQLLLAGRDEQLLVWLWWPFKTKPSFHQQKLFVILMLLLFLGLSWFLV